MITYNTVIHTNQGLINKVENLCSSHYHLVSITQQLCTFALQNMRLLAHLFMAGFPQSWKVMEKSHGMKKSWKVMEKSWNLKISKSHGKVMEFCQKTKIFPLFFLFFQNCRQYLSKIAIFATNKFLIRPSEFC